MIATTLRSLTDSERAFYARPENVTKLGKLVATGEIKCDCCDAPAQTFGVAGGRADAVSYACYSAYIRRESVTAREASKVWL